MDKKQILVTGATGYIGGRLIPRLLQKGHAVRVLVRGGADRLTERKWHDKVDVVDGNVLKPETLPAAFSEIDVAYYLIHSMSDSHEFTERERKAATNFSKAAADANIQRIVYLGGLGDPDSNLTDHLRSRQKTGELLKTDGVPVTEFRAAIVVGSGSVSFELVRHLTERVPLLISPRWVTTKVQPIAVDDVLTYLVAALSIDNNESQIVQIGGTDILSYGDMMLAYADERDLSRRIVKVPVLTPRLSSYWAHLVTPIPAKIAHPLIEGLRSEVIVKDDSAKQLFPNIEPMSYRAAIQRALERVRDGAVETVWSDAIGSHQGDLEPIQFVQEQGMFIERREMTVAAPPEYVYRAFTGFGGAYGWPPYDFLWEIRGLMDRVVGGVGVRRGRRNAAMLRAGDALDFWRVEKIQRNKLLRLRAEMKVPGRAWLQYEVEESDGSMSNLIQTAYFAPKGLLGLLYWYGVLPLHGLVFPGMVNDVKKRAEKWAKEQKPAIQGD